MINVSLFSKESTTWITPPELFNDIHKAFDIELDPYAHDEVLLSFDIKSITKKMNGLDFKWDVNTFINPPYSDIEVWVNKTVEESKNHPDKYYVMLLPSRTDRSWFRTIMSKAYAVCFISKRLRFSGSKNTAPFPSLLAVLSENKTLTDEQFKLLEKLGYVV